METIILIFTISISLFFLKACSGSFSVRYVNGVNYIFYRQMIIGTLIGSYLISIRLEFDRWYVLDWLPSVRFWGFVSVCYSIIVTLMFLFCLKKIFIKNKEIKTIKITDNVISLAQGVLLIISSLGFIYIYINSPSWPMLQAINGENLAALEGRIAFRSEFSGSVIVRNIYCFLSACFYLYLSFSRFLVNKTGRNHLILSIFIALLVFTYNSQKGAILNVLIGMVIIYCLFRGFIPLKWFIFSIAVAVLLILTLFSVVKGINIESLISSGSQLIIGRLIFGNVEGFFNSLQLYPDVIIQNSHLVGLPSFVQESIIGGVQEPSKLTLMKYFDQDGVSNGTSGYITSYFLAEAWANYGIMGILISPFVIAINLFIVELIFSRFGKSVFSASFYAMMYLQFQLHGEFVGFLYFKYFFIFLVFLAPFLFLFFILNRFKKVTVRRVCA